MSIPARISHLEVRRSGWGYGFSFRDPEGNAWGVAVKYGSRFDDSGGFISPDSPHFASGPISSSTGR